MDAKTLGMAELGAGGLARSRHRLVDLATAARRQQRSDRSAPPHALRANRGRQLSGPSAGFRFSGLTEQHRDL